MRFLLLACLVLVAVTSPTQAWPRDFQLLLRESREHLNAGDYHAAQSEAEMAIAQGPPQSRARVMGYELLGLALVGQGRYREASLRFSQGVSLGVVHPSLKIHQRLLESILQGGEPFLRYCPAALSGCTLCQMRIPRADSVLLLLQVGGWLPQPALSMRCGFVSGAMREIVKLGEQRRRSPVGPPGGIF